MKKSFASEGNGDEEKMMCSKENGFRDTNPWGIKSGSQIRQP